MPVFEKRGTRPGFIQMNITLWIFMIVALCISIGIAIFLGTRDPLHSRIERRTVQILTYTYPSCRDHRVTAITFTDKKERIIETVSCGVKDQYYFRNDGLEPTPNSPNYGKFGFLSDKPKE
ncbi:MAG: hypothetical protein N2746_03095 [Deltaproteobacteria bacterium]|nr:hypothetical protein [Deltaproteobacteria bacterium]